MSLGLVRDFVIITFGVVFLVFLVTMTLMVLRLYKDIKPLTRRIRRLSRIRHLATVGGTLGYVLRQVMERFSERGKGDGAKKASYPPT